MTLDIGALFTTASTMFFIIVIGFIIRKVGFMTNEFSKSLSTLILCVAQPFLIIASITGNEFSIENLKSGGTVLLIAIIVHAVAAAVAFISVIGFKDNYERVISEFSIIFANCGFFGFPLLKALYGNIGLFWGGFYVIIYNSAVWTYGLVVLRRANKNVKIRLFKLLVNYGITPSCIGLLLYVLRVPIPTSLYNAMDYMASLCTPISLIITGGLVATMPLKKLFTNFKIYYSSLIKLVVLPVIAAAVLKLLGFSSEMVVLGTIMAAMPTAANTAMFAETYDMCPDYAAQGVAITSVLAVLTIPLSMYIASFII